MLIASDSHRLGIVAVLPLPGRLLHLLVGNLKAREAMAHNQSESIRRRQLALVVKSEIACRSVVGEVLRHHGIQVVAGHAARSTCSQDILLPGFLYLSKRAGGVKTAAVEH